MGYIFHAPPKSTPKTTDAFFTTIHFYACWGIYSNLLSPLKKFSVLVMEWFRKLIESASHGLFIWSIKYNRGHTWFAARLSHAPDQVAHPKMTLRIFVRSGQLTVDSGRKRLSEKLQVKWYATSQNSCRFNHIFIENPNEYAIFLASGSVQQNYPFFTGNRFYRATPRSNSGSR